MFLAKGILGGLAKIVSNINPSDFVPSDPPPPRRPLNFAESHENEEEKRFRRTFEKLAGDDMEICPVELKNILDDVCRKIGVAIGDNGFSIETCRSMVAVMDSDSTGKLGFHEFKYLWNNIKKWQGIFAKFDQDRSGCISERELPSALTAAGFNLSDPKKGTADLYALIVRRYADQHGNMDFDSFVGCLVRLDTMCRAFKTLDKSSSGSIDLGIEEWLQLTMYS